MAHLYNLLGSPQLSPLVSFVSGTLWWLSDYNLYSCASIDISRGLLTTHDRAPDRWILKLFTVSLHRCNTVGAVQVDCQWPSKNGYILTHLLHFIQWSVQVRSSSIYVYLYMYIDQSIMEPATPTNWGAICNAPLAVIWPLDQDCVAV